MVSLQKNTGLEGLSTISNLLSDLKEEIFNEIYAVTRSRNVKKEIEKKILDDTISLIEFNHYAETIRGAGEVTLVSYLSAKRKRIKRILSILQKAQSRSRYTHLKDDINLLISIFDFLYDKGFIHQLLTCLRKEFECLKLRRISGFMKWYQEEKILLMELSAYVGRLGHKELAEEVIRVVSSSHLERFRFELHQKNSIVACAQFMLCFFFVSSEDLISGFYGIRKRYIIWRKKVKKKEDELIVKIGKKYGIAIPGFYYDRYGLELLEEVLSRYPVAEIRKCIDVVSFSIHLPGIFGYFFTGSSEGLYDSFSKKIVLYYPISKETIEHEVAHARDKLLPRKLRSKFTSVNKKFGVPYRKARTYTRKIEGYPVWNIGGDVPNFGYAEPYGTTNVPEDIATFVEMITANKYREKDWRIYFKRYAQAYIGKATLLYKFGFIAKEQRDAFIDYLYSQCSVPITIEAA